ncbi:MAG: ABC transporter ATP-binding protein [Sulfurimonas sp.]|jgi:ABC-2 type transport system ATP-binding protein|nr:ABC transporter ATP-binding protein [Sulfurimonadaceae bacterium]
MIEVRNLTKKFAGHTSLDNVTCTFKKGDSVALMGANGAGKTTLVRSILGYYHPNSGDVVVNGHDPIKQRVEVLKDISFVPQLPPPIKLTISELLEFVSISSDINKNDIISFAKEMKLDILKNLDKSFFKLSGGMKQKLLIAIALSKKSDILIFDEPTANLDPEARTDFHRLLKDVEKDKIMLFITHRFEEVDDLVNRQIYMDLGKITLDEKV